MSNKVVLVDDFDEKLNLDIWETKRTNPNFWKIESSTLKITIKKGIREITDKSNIDRVELSEREEVMMTLGKSVWYSFSFLFPKDFPIVDNRLVFAQWKQYAPHFGSPFLSVRYINNILSFKVTAQNVVKVFKKDIDLRGLWHKLTLNYKLNTDQTGFVRSWLNNEQILDYDGPMDYFPPPKHIFFKMGLYRDSIPEPQSIYFKNFRRGPTRESVII